MLGTQFFSIGKLHKAKFNSLLSLDYLSFSLSEGSDLAVIRRTRSKEKPLPGSQRTFFGTSLG